MIRFYNFEQRSPKWFSMRADRWTGSTAIDLLQGKSKPPVNDSDYDNRYMQRGRILEPLAIEAYERKTGNTVSHFGFVTNSEYKHAGYSPDGIEPDTVVEVKCVNVEKHMAIGTGAMPIPTAWVAQTHFGIVITGLHKIKLVLYNPDAETPLFILNLPVQPAIIDNLVNRLEETKTSLKPSQLRAAKRYVENNPLKIKEARRRRYLKSKSMIK
jgi:hypothetical protein